MQYTISLCLFPNIYAVTPMDYQEVDVLLLFEACQMRSCVNVVIEDDEVLENIESLIVNLERTPGLDSRIELDPVRAVIEITDNDSKWCSLHAVMYHV